MLSTSAVSMSGPPTINVVTSSLATLRSNVLSAVAGTVNTSVADLQGRLRAGQSLSDVARSSGVSRTDLLATVREALSATGGLVADLPQDKVVQRIADHRQKVTRPSGHEETSGHAADSTDGKAGSTGAGGSIGGKLDVRL